MSTRRTPLTSNPNVANSPLRGASALGQAKQKRSFANASREEPYGGPPPSKKQMLDGGLSRTRASPSKTRNTSLPQRVARPAAPKAKHDESIERIRQWQAEYHSRFPNMVFYFESISEDLRAKLSKQAVSLRAREERFFSVDITHVVTTRPIPVERPGMDAVFHDGPEGEGEGEEEHQHQQQPQTINPSLLNRSTDTRRRLFENATKRGHNQPHDDGIRMPKPTYNPNDVLLQAKSMGKKIWTLEKFQRILEILLEPDPYVVAHGKAEGTRHGATTRKVAEKPGLSQMLQHERLNGPSDRDPTVASRELIHFKGPYIYVYDMDEKQKPIMVREYPKVNQKYEGEWPQFRTVTDGRCPFVEELDPERTSRKTRAQESQRPVKQVAESRPALQPPQPPVPKAAVGSKRSLSEMQDGQNQVPLGTKSTESFESAKPLAAKSLELRAQAGFTSRAAPGRLFGGEPVASGVQPSNITSAIRSQMISSASGVGAAKAGTSKEVHGLQRKVLQRSTNSQDPSSRWPEVSAEVASSRSTGVGRTASRRLELIEEDADQGEGRHTRASSKSQPAPVQKSKRDLKPGYCENCQDKYRDFDEHILSRKHRKFAENNDNWRDLDDLIVQLRRAHKPRDPEELGTTEMLW